MFGVVWAKGFKRFCIGFAEYQRSLIFEGYAQIILESWLSLAKCVMMCLGNKKPCLAFLGHTLLLVSTAPGTFSGCAGTECLWTLLQ